MAEERMSEARRMGDAAGDFVRRLAPMPQRYDSVSQALTGLLPATLQAHCRVAGLSDGALKLMADRSSYMFELQLCKAVLLRELQRLCPGARVRRIEVALLR
jgi:hypothetical protein